MATKTEKTATPPLVSYSSYTSFLNQLREHGTVPTRIDKTLMPKASGSQISAMLAALKYLGLIDDAGKPNDQFTAIVVASDEERKPLLTTLVKHRYAFLFSSPEFDLEKATSGEMAEKFRALDISGSTVTKTIAFFLQAAKDAGIKVSSHIKAPAAPKNGGGTRKLIKERDEALKDEVADENEDPDAERFEIPIPGKSSVKVIVPGDLDADDWEMLQSMITVYIKRWKGFKDHTDKESKA